jgi:3-oxoacyl-(acyl-carrier-protein) synthase
MTQRVVITGLGVCSSLGSDIDSFWTALCDGQSGVRALPELSANEQAVVGGAVTDLPDSAADKPNKRAPDRMIQLSDHAVAQALRSHKLPIPADSALFWGTGYTSIATIEACYEAWFLHNRVRADTVPACMPAAVLPHLCNVFGLRGMSTLVSASCASGLQTIGLAYDLLRHGVIQSAVVGSADAPLTRGMYRAWKPLRVLASDLSDPARACRPFSADRTGLVLAEGAAAFVLETLDHALAHDAPIFAEITGFAATTAGGSIVAPYVVQQRATLRLALARAELAPGAVDYINAHATATKIGDTAEVETIKTVFGHVAARLPVSAIKGATGHAMGASSAIEALATVLAIYHQVAPPTINWLAGDPVCDLDCVPHTARALPINHAVKESFGFGGSNAVLVLRRWDIN